MAPNKFSELIPRFKKLKQVIKVIDVSTIADGGTLSIAMDGESNRAMAYLVPVDHWVWRMGKLEELAAKLNPKRYGVVALYVFGSTHEGTAGAKSDIDLLVHHRGTEEQKEDLLAWFKEQSQLLDEENRQRTGKHTEGILDVHIITDKDIQEKTSWACHIDPLCGSAKKIPLSSDED